MPPPRTFLPGQRLLASLILCCCALVGADDDGLRAKATAAGLTGDLESGLNPATGPLLRSGKSLVTGAGVLTEQALSVPDRAGERAEVVAAAKAFTTALRALPAERRPNEPGLRAVEAMLALVDSTEEPERDEDLRPGFVRRVLRSGWASRLGVEARTTERLQRAMDAAGALRPIRRHAGGPELRLEELRDAWGAGGWILTTPSGSTLGAAHPDPCYARKNDLDLALDLPPGADPLKAAERAVAARVSRGGRILARWSASAGFTADPEAWRSAIRPSGTLKGAMPPHLLLTALDGSPLRLVCATGSLDAPRAGQDPQAWLDSAAKALPDAAHLDLLGNYFLQYVHDSPDSRFPGIIGSRADKGEIHQTANALVATATCGQAWGDCDDAAELYQVIAEKQGRLGHCAILPGHTAFVFAEPLDGAKGKDEAKGKAKPKTKGGGKGWRVVVLQTGPALEFTHQELPEALRLAYSAFDKTAPFDPNGLGLLLRFSGENVRGPFRLGWRIYAEPDYARTMIDVQRDWQYQTYASALAKMRRLVEAGDRDPANLQEISGLYQFTGQYAKAAELQAEAVEASSDPVGRVEKATELVGLLLRAGRKEEAGERGKAILEKDLPAAAPRLKLGVVQAGLQLADTLADDHPALAAEALKRTAMQPMHGILSHCAQFLGQPRYPAEEWDRNFMQLRMLARMYAAVGIRILEHSPTGSDDQALKLLDAHLRLYLARIAFHDRNDASDLLARYALAGRAHALGQDPAAFAARLDPVALPKADDRQHARRDDQLPANLDADLPWIRLSVPFWLDQMEDLTRPEVADLDRKRFAFLVRMAKEAAEACIRLKLDDLQGEMAAHQAALLGALAAADEPGLRRLLRFVKAKDDKNLRDRTAMDLGRMARWCDKGWWGRVLTCWQEELDYKPKWFSIAWTAVLHHAPDQGLEAGRRAAARFKDDASFQEEARFMAEVLGK